MYAHTRDRETPFVRVVGVEADGSESSIPIREIAGTRDPLIAQSLLNRAARIGETDSLCEEIADRVTGTAVSIAVFRETHDVVDRARGRASMRQRTSLASCDVP